MIMLLGYSIDLFIGTSFLKVMEMEKDRDIG